VSEVIHVLGEGGAVFEMTLPLHPAIAKRYEAGDIVRVNPDGSLYTEDEPPAPRRRTRAKGETAGDAPGD
jgi:hypothetical protein